MPDDFNEFDELDAAEERIAAREGVNIWGRPLKTEDISWRPHPEAARPPAPVNTLAKSKEETTVDRMTARDLGMYWDAPPGLVEACIKRHNQEGPTALATEFKVPVHRLKALVERLRDRGLVEKLPRGKRAGRGRSGLTNVTKVAATRQPPAASPKPRAQILETKVIGETVTQEETLDGGQSIAIEKVLELRIRIQVEVAEK